jgi:long-chain acyl-CoA synthetase
MGIAAPTLAKAFERQALRYGARAFLSDKHNKTWRDHSWTDVADSAMRLRTGLIKLGITPGDRVAILADNCPEWVIVDQAVLGIGAIVVPLYTTIGPEEMRHIINDSGARLIAVRGDSLIQKVRELGDLPAVEGILAMDPEAVSQEGPNLEVITLKQLSDFGTTRSIEGGLDQVATFIYTSGTTGPSKGVMLTHGNIIANCESNITALRLTEKDIVLSFLPIAHSFERTAGYYTVMAAGGTIAYAEGLSQLAQNLIEVEPTVVLTVPRLLEVIYGRIMRTIESSRPKRIIFRLALRAGMRAAEYRARGASVPSFLSARVSIYRDFVFRRIRAIFGSRLRYLISGGAPLPVEINRFFAAIEVPLVEGYGLTEAAPVVSCNLHNHTKIGTVGRPLEGIEVRTAVDGELLVRGSNVMLGYYMREAETQQAIDDDGWLHTGDIAEIDSDGYIKITDRKKEIIVLSGGKNVSPGNLEAKLTTDRYISQACVVGDRRKHLAAILVPNFENLVAEQLKLLGLNGKPPAELVLDPKLRDFFHKRLREFNRPLSDVEAITDFVLTADSFTQENGELTPTLKLRRRIVQEHYRAAIDKMYGA